MNPPPKSGSTLSLLLDMQAREEERIMKPMRLAYSKWLYGVARQVIAEAERQRSTSPEKP